jgi:four helix bundle protein
MIQRFNDLTAWKVSHQLVLETYRTTRAFPRDELFGLTSQLRRAAVSITSNIAEGFVRNSRKDKINFYTIALASGSELRSQIVIARDSKYISEAEYVLLEQKAESSAQLISGLIRTAPGK